MNGPGPGWRHPDAWRDARAKLEEGAGRFRAGTRGLLLPLFTWPLLPDAVIEIARGNTRGVVAAALGLGLPLLALRTLRRGRAGDTRRAAVLMAVATGLVAGLGAQMGAPLAVLLAAGAWAGTRLMYDGAVPEVEAPPPPAAPGPLDEARARLSRIAAAPALTGVTGAMAAVLDDLDARPDRLPLARRFLAVHLDGLERIADRLHAGAEPPPGMPKLLEDLQSAAEELRARLRAEESAALDIQVKVLAERLRQEGYA
ncbi:hypothetical protein [Falsiroseomonas ponticola]|uniref:hypothetical protein n=1 Tax=Falsiroseomonas ponticola TaxID=2786951 RepID=UPI0019339534|nr:hypothetical protein [Roseomonas ponticola]